MSIKINYLLLYVDEELQEKIIERFGTPRINIFLNKYNKELKNSDNFNQIDLLYTNYDKSFLSSLPPIDENILAEMQPYSYLYFKNCSRRNQNNSFITYEEIVSSYYDHLKFWNWKIDNAKISHLFAYSIPHEGADIIIYSLCKIKGIKTFMTYRLPIIPNTISKRYFIKDIFKHNYDKFHRNHNYFEDKNISLENLEESFKNLFIYFNDEKSNNKKSIEKKRPYRIAKYKNFSLKENLKILMLSFKEDGLLKTINKIKRKNSIIQKLKYRNPFLISEKIINKYYKANTIKNIPNKSFIFFPLHFQPELSSDILGRFYNDQNLVLDMLAWIGQKYDINIIVKKHPRKDERLFLRPRNFYEKMNIHKNVYFVDNNFSTTELIEESIATASITGSSCWESFLKGKPSILFGSVIFENAPGTFKISSKKDLEKALKDIIKGNARFKKSDILNFLKYLEKNTFNCSHKKLIGAAPFSLEESNINFVKHLENFLLD